MIELAAGVLLLMVLAGVLLTAGHRRTRHAEDPATLEGGGSHLSNDRRA